MNARVISDDDLWEFYYDAMEQVEIGDLPEAEDLLRQALILEPDFVAAHVGMVAVYQEGGFTEGVREFTESGYAETKKRFKRWPDSLTWSDIDSRQYLRAICNKAALHHIDGENKQADKLYRLLLKQTPNDNQGVRYLLAGMHAGISPDEVNAMFDASNRRQDWAALESMLDKQNAKYHTFGTFQNLELIGRANNLLRA